LVSGGRVEGSGTVWKFRTFNFESLESKLHHYRVEMGIGEGGSATELHPFDSTFHDKREV
jgi:hypothetical protein